MISSLLSNIIVLIYGLASLFTLLYTITQFSLFLSYTRKKKVEPKFFFSEKQLPLVTIQLPIFNEKYVVERLLNCIQKIEYPHLEIQVLDDSTDESLLITQEKVKELQKEGLNISLIHRTSRENFKAGALKNGLKVAKGEFIAIFDADFLPEPNWLNKTIHFFTNPSIGVVQTRWQHINRNYGLLTQIQGMALDYHFTIEQVGRNQEQHFINFNGTAGIWRKGCILDAGNWEGDTLTEDLDLSYRAQMKNWEFIYLEDVGTPSELPVVMSAVKSQQFRWNKGGAENFRKFALKVIGDKSILLKHKIQAISHLLNSSVFIWVFLISFFSVPLLLVPKTHFDALLVAGTALKYSAGILFFVFYTTFRKTQSSELRYFPKYVLQFVQFFPVILGLSFHNSIAVIEGYFGIKSPFIRTPKFNIIQKSDSWKENKYLSKKITFGLFCEFLLVLYFILGIYIGIQTHNYSFVPFHSLLILGYCFVVIKSLNE